MVRAGQGNGVADRRWTRRGFLHTGASGVALAAAGSWPWRALAAVAASPRDVHHYHSRPDLKPPILTILHRDAPSGDYLFLAPSSGPGQRGVLIVDDRGDVVWFHPTTPNTAMNFRTAVYRGQPVLTWWEGKAVNGLGQGTHVIYDMSYREIARVPAGNGRQSDLHEFQLTADGTALITSYEVTTADLRAFGGSASGNVVGGIVQELELPSGRVLSSWHSLDHVPIGETHASINSGAFDYFHVNSIDVDGDGNLLVSARNTWAVYKVGRKSGEVLWRLGGRKSDFAMGPGTTFAWQHDARHHEGGELISVFDDGAAPQVQPQSRVLLIDLDRKRRRATLRHKYVHRPERLVAKFMGNAQVLGNGDVVVGWGSEPYVTEFAPDGKIVFDAKLPHGGENYRAFRFPWTGRPAKPPALAVAPDRTLYASWNGATGVASWRLLAGGSASRLETAGTARRVSFETKLTRPAAAGRFVAVEALDARGRVLGRSAVVHA